MSAIGLLSHGWLDTGLLGKGANLLGGKPRMDLTEWKELRFPLVITF